MSARATYLYGMTAKMLLITDRAESIIETKFASRIVRLDEVSFVGDNYDAIACDVALGGFADAAHLQRALSRYRRDPATPLTMVVERGDVLGYALANALGANRIVSRGNPAATTAATAAYGIHCEPAAPGQADAAVPKSGIVPLAGLVEAVATSLSRLFEGSRRHQRISLKTLAEGTDALLVAVRQNGIRDFLDMVRTYDEITYQHCLLVAGLVTSFAARRGMSGASQRLLAQAALVHDIGKARVPLAILNKPGPLTAEEMDVMRKHPATGYYMIAHQPGMDIRILDIVRHHHEYIDGSGYPDRLRGEQISEFCRIVTICDIFAALMERRVYKAPMPPLEGYTILLDMGRKLDAGLVAEFKGLVDEMVSERATAA